MVNFNKNKKGVELALNTIVIAILIIIVLLVIVLIFTSKITGTNDTLNQNSPTACNLNNPILKPLVYGSVQEMNYVEGATEEGCNGAYKRISVIPISGEAPNKKVCCGMK